MYSLIFGCNGTPVLSVWGKKELSKCRDSYKMTQFIKFLYTVSHYMCQRDSQARFLPKKTQLQPYGSGSKKNLAHCLSELNVCNSLFLNLCQCRQYLKEHLGGKAHCWKRSLFVAVAVLIYWLFVTFAILFHFLNLIFPPGSSPFTQP